MKNCCLIITSSSLSCLYYRVDHHVSVLGWVEFDFGCSTVSLILLGLKRDCRMGRAAWQDEWNIQIKVTPTHVRDLMAGHPVYSCSFPFFQKSRRSEEWLQGRTDGGIRVNFPKTGDDLAKGDYVVVDVTESNSQGLKGSAVNKSSIAEFDLATGVRIAHCDIKQWV